MNSKDLKKLILEALMNEIDYERQEELDWDANRKIKSNFDPMKWQEGEELTITVYDKHFGVHRSDSFDSKLHHEEKAKFHVNIIEAVKRDPSEY